MPYEADQPDELRYLARMDVPAVAVVFRKSDGGLEEIKGGRRPEHAGAQAYLQCITRRREPGLVVVIQRDTSGTSPQATYERLGSLNPDGHQEELTIPVTVRSQGNLEGGLLHFVAGARQRGRPPKGSSGLLLAVIEAPDHLYRSLLDQLATALENTPSLRRPSDLARLVRGLTLDAEDQEPSDHDARADESTREAPGPPPATPGTSTSKPATPERRGEGEREHNDLPTAEELDALAALTKQLDESDRLISRWEQDLRTGSSPTPSVRTQQEVLMRELVEEIGPRAVELGYPHLVGRHSGLEARLGRLFDVQAQRDATGPIQSVLTVLTALVLVPTLVAGVYGSNVGFPWRETREGFLVMAALMAASSALLYSALSALEYGPTGSKVTIGQLTKWWTPEKPVVRGGGLRLGLLSASFGVLVQALDATEWTAAEAPSTQVVLFLLASLVGYFMAFDIANRVRTAKAEWRERVTTDEHSELSGMSETDVEGKSRGAELLILREALTVLGPGFTTFALIAV